MLSRGCCRIIQARVRESEEKGTGRRREGRREGGMNRSQTAQEKEGGQKEGRGGKREGRVGEGGRGTNSGEGAGRKKWKVTRTTCSTPSPPSLPPSLPLSSFPSLPFHAAVSPGPSINRPKGRRMRVANMVRTL
jgi:hypothetical protein